MGPLDNVKVIELGQLIAGPFCGQLLADFGAEVVKIEPPEKGDAMRQWGRTDAQGNTLWWPVIARNKKSVTLDLRQPDGQEVLKALVRSADVLIENFRPGTMERWGLGWDVLSEINPRLIMVRITGFGQTGPYAGRAGFASVCEAMGGLRFISGYPDRPPVRVGISLGDSLAGINGMMGTLLALHHRERTGRGQVVDASILESVLGVMESLVSEYDKAGYIRERSGSTLPGIAPSNAYPSRDGRDVIIGANQDTVFRRLCEVMGAPELAQDPRYATHRARGDHQAELDETISRWTRERDADEIVEMVAANGIPVGLAYRAPEMLADPHFAAREAVTRVADAKLGDIAMQNVFPRLSVSPGGVRHTGPELGEHTEEVLSNWLDWDKEKIDALRARGTV
jgi:crotonobetainyl-CoA:carnitine CoA-transferase CaiB-like acyl-CoA transferase